MTIDETCKIEINAAIRQLQRIGDTWNLNARRAWEAKDNEAAEKFREKANECYEKAAALRLKEMFS